MQFPFPLFLPQNSQKGGVNMRFQAKCAKYSNFCIIKTTMQFQPNFEQWWRPPNSSCGSSQNLPHISKMTDDRHLEKRINCYISATVPPISTKFCMLTHIGPLNPKRCSKNQFFFKSKMADDRHFENVKCDISATVWPILVKFGMVMHISPSNLTGDQKFKNLKIQDGRQWPSWSRKIAISPKPFGRFWWNFAWWHIFVLQSLPAVQKIKF